MATVHVPSCLKDHAPMLSCGNDIHVVRYQQAQEVIRQNVELEMNVVTIVLRGCKEVHHHSGHLTILPQQGFFLKSGSYLMTEKLSSPDQGFEALSIFFTDQYLAKATSAIFSEARNAAARKQPSTYDNVILLQEDVLLNGLVRQMVQYFEQPVDGGRMEKLLPMKIRELLEVLTTSEANNSFLSFLGNIHFARVPGLVQVMEANFRENLSMEQFAFLAGSSLSTFKRQFEETYHQSPGRWIQQRRLQEAYYLLADPRKNVTEVCFEAGFENLAHFIAAFKEQYHVTPGQMQQALLEGASAD